MMALPPKPGMSPTVTMPHPSSSPSPNGGGNGNFPISRGLARQAHKITIYGAGGVGKTSLAALIPDAVIVDLEDGSLDLDCSRVSDVTNWERLRALIQSNVLDEFSTIVIDSATKAEQLAVAWTLGNIKGDKGQVINRLESYGYGKGYSFSYETMLALLGDLDRHFRAGRNVVLICHECVQRVPNPDGEDWIRWEPRLQNQTNGNVRAAIKEWSDHLIYVGYDVATDDEGKAKGAGTRTIYLSELPIFWAKARGIDPQPIVYELGNDELWKRIFKKGQVVAK